MRLFSTPSIVLLAAAVVRCGATAEAGGECATDRDCHGLACDLGVCVEAPRARALPAARTGATTTGSSIDPDRLSPRFRLALDARVVAAPVLSAEGDAIVATIDGRIVRVAANGRIAAEARIPATVRGTPAVDAVGTIAVGSTDGVLRLFDRDLHERNRLALGDPIVGPIHALSNGLFAVPTRGVALVTPNGTEIVRRETASVVRGGAVLHPAGFVVFASAEGELIGFRVDGSDVFRTRIDANSDGSPAVLPDGSIVIGTDLAQLVRVGVDGTVRGRFETTLDLRATPIARADGTVVVATLDGSVHILDESLAPRHSSSFPGTILASPRETAEGQLVVGTSAGFLHLLDRDATAIRTLPIGAPIHTTPLLLPDETLVVVSDDGIVRGYR